MRAAMADRMRSAVRVAAGGVFLPVGYPRRPLQRACRQRTRIRARRSTHVPWPIFRAASLLAGSRSARARPDGEPSLRGPGLIRGRAHDRGAGKGVCRPGVALQDAAPVDGGRSTRNVNRKHGVAGGNPACPRVVSAAPPATQRPRVRPTLASARATSLRPWRRAAEPLSPGERPHGTRTSVDGRRRAGARDAILAAGPQRSRRVRGHGPPAGRVDRLPTPRPRLAPLPRVVR